MNQPSPITFACDAMLGGLARWLRAAGYDASWRADIGDCELIRTARYEDRMVLTSDTGIMHRGVIRDKEVPALFVPHGLGILEQLTFVLKELHLPLRESRRMTCGGALIEISKDQAQERVPPRSFAWVDHFWECESCRHVFWKGTHWTRIMDQLQRACRFQPEANATPLT
jgi:uncharacterized protein with PIN domain